MLEGSSTVLQLPAVHWLGISRQDLCMTRGQSVDGLGIDGEFVVREARPRIADLRRCERQGVDDRLWKRWKEQSLNGQ
jgi:hypothetical protein